MAYSTANMNRIEMGLGGVSSGSDSEEHYSATDFSDDEKIVRCVRTRPLLLGTLVVSVCAAACLFVYASYDGQASSGPASSRVEIDAQPAKQVSPMPSTVNYALVPHSTTFAASPVSATLPTNTETAGSALPPWVSATTSTPTIVANPMAPNVSAPAAAANTRRKPHNPLKPGESLQDGNVCDDSEELYAGLCYKKCSILTGGTHPHRSTAFSCCATNDCGVNVFNLQTASLIPCEGYDVSNAENGTSCPHFPGTCLTDEELFMGQCYEKCSVLTDGEFPNRVAAMTCCSTQGVDCLDPFNDRTKAAFLVGGGKGDHDAETPRGPHGPLQSLTEAQA